MKNIILSLLCCLSYTTLIAQNINLEAVGPSHSFRYIERSSIALGDIDNDGDLDVLITGSGFSFGRFAELYVNDGTGNFTLKPNTPLQLQSEGDFEFEDVDNDGDLDLLTVSYTHLRAHET